MTSFKPAIILVRPQLGDNIGTVARAMLNFGLTDLRLVNPKPGWDVERARKASSGAEELIEKRKEYQSFEESIADLNYLIATTARPRDMVKTTLTPKKVASEIRLRAGRQQRCGLVYGPERTGLHNDEIAQSDAICRIPVNPDFSSLNLAQAVLLTAYCWFEHEDVTPAMSQSLPNTRPANRSELNGMFNHLENALDHSGFLLPEEKKPAMMRNLKNMFLRADLTEQDIRTFRGVINSLLRWPRGAKDSEMKQRVLAISKGDKDPGGVD
ncbi:MAG: RNA methyltransferase [Parvibaculales bacterium]